MSCLFFVCFFVGGGGLWKRVRCGCSKTRGQGIRRGAIDQYQRILLEPPTRKSAAKALTQSDINTVDVKVDINHQL